MHQTLSKIYHYNIFRMKKEPTYKFIHLQTLDQIEVKQGNPINGQTLWDMQGTKKLLTYQQTCVPTLSAHFQNGFFSAFLYAYENHGDVKITPDDVWLTILLYFSKYVSKNAQKLRYAFVSHEGKKKLIVSSQNELEQSQWDEFFKLMVEQVRNNLRQGVSAKLQSDFTTSQRLQKVLSTAVIMNIFKTYFEYGRCIPGCGIQNVHFGGTLQDWRTLTKKTEQLVDFDVDGQLKRYIKNIKIILEKFIQTYQGDIDLEFWNKIINSEEGTAGSGSTTIFTGWLIHFFGYQDSTEDLRMDSVEVEVEIDNKNTGIIKMVKLVGGFRAVNHEGKVFRPHLSLAIQDAQQPKTPKTYCNVY